MSEPTRKQRIFWFIRDIWRIIISIGGPRLAADSNIQTKNMRIRRDGSVEKIWTHRLCEWKCTTPFRFPAPTRRFEVKELSNEISK